MTEFGRLRRYLTLPRKAARIERDVTEELQAHIALRTEQLERRGHSSIEARAQALREFGDLDDAVRYCSAVDRQAERQHRVTDWLQELFTDARHALRLLRRAPAFTAATVLTLGLALGASTAVYSVLHAYLIRPLPFAHADRLVWISPPREEPGGTRGPSLETVRWASVDSIFAHTMSWDLDGFTFTGAPYAESIMGAWVSEGYFPALGVRVAVGRPFLAEEYHQKDAPVAILSYQLWQRRFHGDSAVIGSSVTMHSVDHPNGPSRVTIVGVLPKDFWPIHWRESELLRPFTADNDSPVMAQLKPGITAAQAEEQLDAVVRHQLTGPVEPSWRMRVVPALEQHSARVRPLLIAIFGAALFMLLAASGSVAGALVSRAASRRREMAIRLALGGSRSRILRQLLTESAVLTMLAYLLGLTLAITLVSTSAGSIERLLGTAVPGGLGALRPTPTMMLLLAGASAIVGTSLGLLPAMSLVRGGRSPIDLTALRAARGGVGQAGESVVRRLLIAGQVLVAMVLLFGAGLMFRSIVKINAVELGFRAEGVVKANILMPFATYPEPTDRRLLLPRILARLDETPGVRSAAAVFPYPFRGGAGQFPVLSEGAPNEENGTPRAGVHTVTPGYFGTMEIPLHAGRDFTPADDHAAPLAIVVSERLARQIEPNGNVLGRRIRVRVPYLPNFTDEDARPWRTIVGVVADARDDFSLDEVGEVYVPYAQNPRSFMNLVVRTRDNEGRIVEPMRRAMLTIDPALTLSGIGPLADVLADETGQRRGLTMLLGGFAVFSLALSALALYASLTYMVVERRPELALRMAIGASAGSILRMILEEGMLTTCIGVFAGAAASLALGRVLASQLYAVAPTDAATLLSISVVLLATVVAACVIPAVRATRIDPALALRE